MRVYFLIALFFLPGMALANERIDLSQYHLLSLMQLPDSSQAVVGILSPNDHQAGFAICDLNGTEFVECRMKAEHHFPLEKMKNVKQTFDIELAKDESPLIGAFEIGVIAALKLTPGQIALYYGLKSNGKATATGDAIQTLARLFNTEPKSPLYVRFPAGADKIRLLAALQFAASSH